VSRPACGSDEWGGLLLAGFSAILSQHAHVSFIFSQHSIFGFSTGAAWACATPGKAIASATAVVNLLISLNSVKSEKIDDFTQALEGEWEAEPGTLDFQSARRHREQARDGSVFRSV
jgi:hypothetical protein